VGHVPEHEKGDNAVRHQNTVFHNVLKHLPWGKFERLVKVHGAEKDERGFTAKTQLVAMIYAQLSGTGSLREIVAGLSSHQTRLYHLGIGKVCRSDQKVAVGAIKDAPLHRPRRAVNMDRNTVALARIAIAADRGEPVDEIGRLVGKRAADPI